MFFLNQISTRPGRLFLQATLALALLVLFCAPKAASAQHHGGAGGGGFPGGMSGGAPMGGGGFPRSADVPSEMSRNSNGVRMHGALQVGPPGRWWDDKHFAKQLKLSEDQQRHMDVIFEQNRPLLLKRLESLGIEEQHMEALTHAKTLDEQALFAQVDRIEQARADLGKATLHYQVQLHNELGPDQLAKLEEQQQ
jgi:Spy/CpxP family protein refolding chaperone